jgi:hypothetical protein
MIVADNGFQDIVLATDFLSMVQRITSPVQGPVVGAVVCGIKSWV